jgi:hypothetical protein
MELFIMRKGFAEAEDAVLELIRFQRTAAPGQPLPPEAATVPGATA